MPATVTVNSMTVVHKSSNGVSTAFPDVCKTPCAPSPVPIPYPNIAMSSTAAETASSVTADGNPIMVKSSKYATSSGDEPGTLLGVVSNSVKAAAFPAMFSMDVKAEGKNVFRQLDIMVQNGNNKPTNTPPAPNLQPPLVVMADGQDPEKYKIIEVKWSKAKLKCGDPVQIETKTENFDDGMVIPHTITREPSKAKKKNGITKEIIDNTQGNVGGNAVTIDWVTRNGTWRKTPTELEATATGKGGPKKSSGKLKIDVPPEKDGPHITKKTVLKEGVIRLAVPGRRSAMFKPRGKYWKMTYGYDISLKQGVFQIHCKIKLKVQAGVRKSQLPKLKKAMKSEIENMWDRKWKEHRKKCKRGKNCNCPGGCCLFPIRVKCTFVKSGENVEIALFRGSPDTNKSGQGWWNAGEWWEQKTGKEGHGGLVYAHEFGHAIGMWDEYPNGAVSEKYYAVQGSIMGRGSPNVMRHHWMIYPDPGSSIHKWFLSNAGDKYELLKT